MRDNKRPMLAFVLARKPPLAVANATASTVTAAAADVVVVVVAVATLELAAQPQEFNSRDPQPAKWAALMCSCQPKPNIESQLEDCKS